MGRRTRIRRSRAGWLHAEDVYVTASPLTTLFRPLFWSILAGNHIVPRTDGYAWIRDIVWSDGTRPGTSRPTFELVGARKSSGPLVELQSVGGRNRFLGIAVKEETVWSVGQRDGDWVEWRPFYFESLAANFTDGEFSLHRRRGDSPVGRGSLDEYITTLDRAAARLVADDGSVGLSAIFSVSRSAAAQTILNVARQVARLHEQGRIHGDLKPNNVVLTAHQPTLIDDFNLAAGEVAPGWTANWSAPEQVLGYPVTPAADVYPLGMMVVQLLMGRLVGEVRKFRTVPLPADRRAEFDIFYNPDVYVEPAQTVVTPTGLPMWLALARACLAFDPERRLRSAAQFVEELQALLASHPLQGVVNVEIPGNLVVARFADGTERVVRLIADENPTKARVAKSLAARAKPNGKAST
jgi:hypothetical protein